MKYETCVVCGKETDIIWATPVQDRETYVLGVGQLCRHCYKEIMSSDMRSTAFQHGWDEAAIAMSRADATAVQKKKATL